MGRLTPIVEMGVAEAHAILTGPLGVDPSTLPPLDAIENEDWGRDLLLSRFLEIPAEALGRVGLCLQETSNEADGSAAEATETPSP
jgi:hypothetical protein